MSKENPFISSSALGCWLHDLRVAKHLTLNAVASEVSMDLALLQKIETGRRAPTEKQVADLAAFYHVDETDMQARRIAERFRNDYGTSPVAAQAIAIIAEEAGIYKTQTSKTPRRKSDKRADA